MRQNLTIVQQMSVYKIILERFSDRVDKQHAEEFYEKLYLNNLERAYLISVMGVISFFFLLVSDYFNMRNANSMDRIISSMMFITHALISFLMIPSFFLLGNKENWFADIYKNKRMFFFLTLAILGFSLLPMAIVSLQTRGSIVVFAIFIIIVNLGFKVPLTTNIIINIISIFVVSIGIFYVGTTPSDIISNLFECWALNGAVFVISSYQFQSEVKQFNYEKLLEEKNKIIKSQLETEFNKKIAEIEMTALRAQMNPHFLFNVLNSIKLYMVQNDARTAARYLTKFSRLIRLILNNSKSPMIKLSEELSALQLYVEMENFRFNDKFDYEIDVHPSINIESVDIPPMILQPYVENAIWHGLMHKEENRGKLTINIQPTKDGLFFFIEDNGIGRERATQIKTRTAAKHKSVGMQITHDRIAITNELFNTNASVSILDLKDRDGNACGTRVIIHLPTNESAPILD